MFEDDASSRSNVRPPRLEEREEGVADRRGHPSSHFCNLRRPFAQGRNRRKPHLATDARLTHLEGARRVCDWHVGAEEPVERAALVALSAHLTNEHGVEVECGAIVRAANCVGSVVFRSPSGLEPTLLPPIGTASRADGAHDSPRLRRAPSSPASWATISQRPAVAAFASASASAASTAERRLSPVRSMHSALGPETTIVRALASSRVGVTARELPETVAISTVCDASNPTRATMI
jgi:hypothetical protein